MFIIGAQVYHMSHAVHVRIYVYNRCTHMYTIYVYVYVYVNTYYQQPPLKHTCHVPNKDPSTYGENAASEDDLRVFVGV